jgi:hypothetical protein
MDLSGSRAKVGRAKADQLAAQKPLDPDFAPDRLMDMWLQPGSLQAVWECRAPRSSSFNELDDLVEVCGRQGLPLRLQN